MIARVHVTLHAIERWRQRISPKPTAAEVTDRLTRAVRNGTILSRLDEQTIIITNRPESGWRAVVRIEGNQATVVTVENRFNHRGRMAFARSIERLNPSPRHPLIRSDPMQPEPTTP